MAPPVDIQRSELNSALHTLNIIINGIPDAFPDGSIDGPLAQYFTSIDFDNKFPYETVDTQWMCVFRREWTQEQLQQLVVHGPLGLCCAHAFITNAIAVCSKAAVATQGLSKVPKWSCTASQTSSYMMMKTVHYAGGKYVIELEKQYVLNFLTLLLGTSVCRQSCYSTSRRARHSCNSSHKCLCGTSILTMQTDTAGLALIYVSKDGFADDS
jgi:hypothetical protein